MGVIGTLLRGRALVCHNRKPVLSLCIDRPAGDSHADFVARLDRLDVSATLFIDPAVPLANGAIAALRDAGHEIGCYISNDDCLGTRTAVQRQADGLMVRSAALSPAVPLRPLQADLARTFTLVRHDRAPRQSRVVDALSLPSIAAGDDAFDRTLEAHLGPRRWLVLAVDAAQAEEHWRRVEAAVARIRDAGGTVAPLRNAAGLVAHIMSS